MNRKMLLRSAAAAAGAAALPAARAQPAPPAAAKPPPVWLYLDQKALDDAYDQSKWATNGKQLLHRYAVPSDDVRTRLGAPQRFSYGATAVEALDVYRARHGAPIEIFIHGGAWRSGTAKEWAFPADLFVHRGAHFVVPDFVSVTDAGGDRSRWPIRCAARSPARSATPGGSAATASGSSCPVTPSERTSPASCSRPTGSASGPPRSW